jgi:two-component sensor histidine kinase
LYFGGINGFSIFDPKAKFTKKPLSKMLLTKMVYSDSENIYSIDIPKAQAFQLTHKNYFVTFEFSVLDFIDPENNQFRYKLAGFDPDWIENGTRNTATYTNLPAGSYVFRVQGANSSDVWNREGISINVEVLPPPWFAWWAWCAYIALSAFLSWLGKRTYDSYAINRRANDLAITMRENEERAYDDIQEHQELHDELINVAHQHNVATLALIRDFIEEQKSYLADELAAEAAEKCIDIVTSLERLEGCLFFHDEGLMADLRKYTDFIFSEKIRTSTIDHESIITINDVTPDLIPADLASPIALVIHEAVENAMEHAFVDSSTANYLQVSFSREAENNSPYTLSITDNGVGIPEQAALSPTNSMGLGIIHSMARTLAARIEISRHNGTEVSLTFTNQAMNKIS